MNHESLFIILLYLYNLTLTFYISAQTYNDAFKLYAFNKEASDCFVHSSLLFS